MDDAPAELLLGALDGLLRRRAGGRLDPHGLLAGRGHVGLRVVVEQHVQHRRRPAEERDVVLVDALEDGRRREVPEDDVLAADAREAVDVAPAVDVEHRRGPQDGVVVLELDVVGVDHRVVVLDAVGVDHALRVAGRPGGVEDGRVVVLADVGPLGGLGRGAGEHRLVVVPAVALDPVGLVADVLVDADGVADLVDLPGVVVVGDQDVGVRVVEQVVVLASVQPEVQRDEQRAELERRVQRLHEVVAVRREHGDAVAVADAAPAERVREPVDALAELGVGVLGAVVGDHADVVAVEVDRAVQVVGGQEWALHGSGGRRGASPARPRAWGVIALATAG